MKKALTLPPLAWTSVVASDSKRAYKAAAVVGSETNQSFLAPAATRRSAATIAESSSHRCRVRKLRRGV